MDTIFALSSGRPPAAIAVVRVSGDKAEVAGRRLCATLPPPRQAAVRTVRGADGTMVDQALCLWFPGPNTATGQDLLELHLHGGRAVIDRVNAELAIIPGLRLAEPGEFTRQALAAGRIDLSQARGLADLLAAETERQRRAAIATADGSIGRRLRGWLDRISDLSARVEALIDYDEEGDVDPGGFASVVHDVSVLANDCRKALAEPSVDRLRHGVRVIFLGPPNAGKSSLFNMMAGREAAIVTSIAGTTRDLIEARVAHDGIPYVLIDTAGLAERTDDPIEAIGIARAHQAARDADIILWFGDAPPPTSAGRTIWLRPKADDDRDQADERVAVSIHHALTISNLWIFIDRLASDLLPIDDAAFDDAQLSEVRAVTEELGQIVVDLPVEIAAFHLATARRTLSSLLGYAATEAMLDSLFSRFCLGK